MLINKQLISSINKYKDILENNKIAIAVSGGIDSLSLLLIGNEWAKSHNTKIIGLTIDHKLRKESTDEALYVNNLCQNLNIEHYIIAWDEEKPETNIEFNAREARYNLMANFCKKNNINYILIAHHLQDQAETFFIRLFRGSSIDGLSAMKDITNIYDINIIRPFLNINKEVLKEFLLENNIKWIEDPSNSDEKYLRNKIRNFLNSFENKKEIVERINFAIDEINKSKIFIDKEVQKVECKTIQFSSFGSCTIDINKLLKQDDDIILKILAKISMKISGNIYKPRLKKLKNLLQNLKTKNNIKYTFYGCIFETYNDNLLMAYREYNSILEDKKLKYDQEIVWDNRFKIILKKNIESLIITHIKNGEFNKILEETKKINFSKYKEMKEIKGIEKHILYTLPAVKYDNKYLLDFKDIEIKNIL